MSSRIDSPSTSRTMSVLEKVVAGWAGTSSRSRIRPVRAVDRDVTVVVTAASLEAPDVMALTLAAADGSDLPAWHPGAHLDLMLPSGKIRQYSLCGDPTDRKAWRIAVRRIPDGGGGSLEVHGLEPGTAVTVRGPRNAFPFAYPHLAAHDIAKVAFVAGGIGITALLPMVRAASHAGVPWTLTYVGRDRASMPFLPEIASFPGGEVRVLTGKPSMGEVLWLVDARTSVYFCGPPSFLDAIRDRLRDNPHAGFHFERFSPPPVVGGQPFTVRLVTSELEVEVPADLSALAAIRNALPDVPYSCQQGYCGTCRVGVLEGTSDGRGTAKFLDGDGTMLICVDRCDGPYITIDL